MTRTRVGFVGAGRRVRDIYLPVLRALSESFEVAGLTSSGASAGELGAQLAIPAFRSLPLLINDARPDLLIVAVSAAQNVAAGLAAIDARCAVLLETPLAPGLAEGRRIASAAARAGRPVGVVEQKAFLPFECFKRKVIESGLLGRVTVVENNFRALGYHAVAQLRRYLADDATAVDVQGMKAQAAIEPFVDVTGKVRSAGQEEWRFATIRFDDGSVAIHQSSTEYKKAPFRMGSSLRVYGTKGSIVGEEIAFIDGSGLTQRLMVERPGPGHFRARAENLPDIVWQSAVQASSLDDDQMGVAEHLYAMRQVLTGARTAPLYRVDDALRDLEILDRIDAATATGLRRLARGVRQMVRSS
jgi:predicted dehydrogenase